jgi:hypothetical protein
MMQRTILFFALMGLALAAGAQTKRYVKPTASGSGDGASWANASSDLQAMINASAAGDSVWVAAGTYKPTAWPTGCSGCIDPRDYTFHVKDGVNLYGGFAGTETDLSQRDIAANETILSGDLGNQGNNSDNCYHVVIAAAPNSGGIGVIIDGFYITGGNANVTDEFIKMNGRTIYSYYGGGIYVTKGTNYLANNHIYENMAVWDGAGIYAYDNNNTVKNNTIYNNSASRAGGGVYISKGNNALLNNVIKDNTALLGGGLVNSYDTTLVQNNIIVGNIGGGISSSSGNNIYINNTIYGNSRTESNALGAGISTFFGQNVLKNNIFWGNSVAGSSTVNGSDYYNQVPLSLNNLFISNALQLASSNYTGGYYGLGSGATGNIFATDPSFANPADPDGADDIFGTADDGLALQAGSPCIDTGTSSGAPSTDITGASRPQGSGFDMGAYEYFAILPGTCIATRTEDGAPIAPATYRAWSSITSHGTVATGSNVVFEAGEAVYLQTGFHAQAGSDFTARIAACSPFAGQQPNVASSRGQVAQLQSKAGQESGSGSLSLQVAPNPFIGETQLSFDLPQRGAVALSVLDLNGRALLHEKLGQLPAGQHGHSLRMGVLPKGVYFLRLESASGTGIQKIVVMGE